MAFMLRITRDDGKEVIFKPGSQMERDLAYEIAEKLKDKGVGFFKTEAKVIAAVNEALAEVLLDAKTEILP